MIWPILGARAEKRQKKVHILGDLKTPKFHSEINWPLGRQSHYHNGVLNGLAEVPFMQTTHDYMINVIRHLYFWQICTRCKLNYVLISMDLKSIFDVVFESLRYKECYLVVLNFHWFSQCWSANNRQEKIRAK